ncbi:MAG: butyrate kinase [Alistipes sp.]|nr:butyrate kinase [Alistipes sp.]
MGYRILAINPGSTSTKVALYDEERPLLETTLRHSTEEVSRFANVIDQLDWRRGLILQTLRDNGFELRELAAVIGRGGLIRPVTAGVYEVNSRMRYDLRNARMKHACNLGGLLAAQIAHMAKVKAYIADPPVVDEMDDVARITGMPMCPRKPIFHALNQKAIARHHCAAAGKVYEQTNLIVAHMGGGISVAAHRQGRIVDVNNALDGDGPFAPDRAGNIPSSELIKVCFSGKYTKEELLKFISSKGGLVALLGTNSVIQAMERIAQGDERAAKVLDAMCYNISKQIGAMAAALEGKVDGILLTGGIAFNEPVVEAIRRRCSFIAPVTVYPGENELEALAINALAVLRGIVEPKIYQ